MSRAGIVGAQPCRHCRGDGGCSMSTGLRRRLEEQRVHELFSRHISPVPGRLVVIGRGPGSNVSRLNQAGYEVEVEEPKKFVTRWSGARSLQGKPGSIDAVLITGPMYSLRDLSERSSTIRGATKALRPGGLLAVVAVNRTARLIGATLTNLLVQQSSSARSDWDIPRRPAVRHTVAELEAELSLVGSEIKTYGITGPGGWLIDVLDAHFSTQCLPKSLRSPSPLETALAAARLADDVPELTYASQLLFAVARRHE